MNVNELSHRLERLERENRRMKRAAFAVVGIALAVALIGAATPKEIPKVIDARLFRVIDEKGKVRAAMGVVGFVLSSEKEKVQVLISPDSINVYGENGAVFSEMTASKFACYDEEGPRSGMTAEGITYIESGELRASMDSAGFVYWGSKGQPRVTIGRDLKGAAGITAFDENSQIRVRITPQGIIYYDERMVQRVSIHSVGLIVSDASDRLRSAVTNEGFVYLDERGTTRASLGSVSIANTMTGQDSRYELALFDDNGDVIWLAPE